MAESHVVTFETAHEVDELVAEICLYLEIVELFRQEDHEPVWRVDVSPTEVLR